MNTGDSRDMLAILAGPGPAVFTTRPVIMGTHGMVTSGHYLASRIGLHILEEGGERGPWDDLRRGDGTDGDRVRHGLVIPGISPIHLSS